MNTLSALAFLIVGFLVFRKSRREGFSRFYTHVYLAALALLFSGTAFFHATLTDFAQWTDGLGLYAVITFAALYVLRLRYNWSNSRFLQLYVAVNIAAGLLSFFFMQYRLPLFGSFVGLTLLLILYLGRASLHFPRGELLATVVLFVVGLAFQVADNRLWLCAPESVWQGHALWHVLSAGAAYTLYVMVMRAGWKYLSQY